MRSSVNKVYNKLSIRVVNSLVVNNINNPQYEAIIIHYHPLSSIIIHYHPLSSIIIHYHPLSSIIPNMTMLTYVGLKLSHRLQPVFAAATS